MASPENSIESFLAKSQREPEEWAWLWAGDREFPPIRHEGVLGRLKFALKALVRKVIGGAQAERWERQRQFNLELLRGASVVQDWQAGRRAELDQLGEDLHQLQRDLQQTQAELSADIRHTRRAQEEESKSLFENLIQYIRKNLEFLESHSERIVRVEEFQQDGLNEIMRHTDALFARVEQRFEAYRRRSRELWARLEGLLAVADSEASAPLVRAVKEQWYVELERQFRGDETDISQRIQTYLPFLEGRGTVLDLGCGRGEALEVLERRGLEARGVDSSAEMVELCRSKGLTAEVGDLFEVLSGLDEESLGAVLSFHVIEHLPPESLDRLVRLAWRALEPGGVLVLETPSPLSLVVAARNFWIDPTHRRPVHPDSLMHSYRLAGFDPVERIDLQPFPEDEGLAEIDPSRHSADVARLVEDLNRQKDRLNSLLFGFQDYGMVGTKPAPA